MGWGFYPGVSELGSDIYPIYPRVLELLTQEWTATGYDMKWLFRIAAGCLVLGIGGYLAAITLQIRNQSNLDEARPADAIIVLGAAEYRGRPSPVLEARLNHALFLYLKGLAPRIITTGGAGGASSIVWWAASASTPGLKSATCCHMPAWRSTGATPPLSCA